MRGWWHILVAALAGSILIGMMSSQPVPSSRSGQIAGNLSTVGGFTTGTSYTEIYGGGANAGIASFVVVPFASSGTVSNLFVYNMNAKDGGGACSLRLVVNSIDTPVVATIPAGGAPGVYKDTTHGVRVSAGDLWTLKVVVDGTACSPGGISFRIQ